MTDIIKYEDSKRKVQAMKKKKLIKLVINEWPTYDNQKIVKEVKRRYNVDVSLRSVQRVRKLLNERKDKMSTENNNPMNDEWDTGQPEDKDVQDEQKTLNQLDDHEIQLLNMINEGGWTVQQLAKETGTTEKDIRSQIDKLQHMITGEVLDEDDPNVYLTKGTQDILDELDALPGGQGGPGVSHTTVVSSTPAAREDFWEVEQDVVKACSKCDKAVNVFMNITSRRKAMLYMKWAGAREWLAYLVGEKIEDDYHITDLYLPDQRTSATLVDQVDTEEFNQHSIVGVIHSHHEMGAGDADKPSFSGHDDAFINANHNLSLLAGRDSQRGGFKIVGVARVKTPCDAFMQVKAKVRSMVEDPEADKAMKDEFLEKTQTQQQTYARNYGNGYGYGYNPYSGYPVAHRGGFQQSQVVHPVVTGEKKTHKPDETGVVQTRGNGFHFTK
jgi:hypothetical protein